MSASGSITPERDQQLLEIGKQCSAPSCLVVDFLPFKCQHCAHAFCRDHFLPADHQCDKFDAAKLDRVAPSCPLCNTPVAIPPGQDPNVRMEQHITTQCTVMTGKSAKAKSAPTCARPKCGKVLFSPIRCDVSEPLQELHRSRSANFISSHASSSTARNTASPKTTHARARSHQPRSPRRQQTLGRMSRNRPVLRLQLQWPPSNALLPRPTRRLPRLPRAREAGHQLNHLPSLRLPALTRSPPLNGEYHLIPSALSGSLIEQQSYHLGHCARPYDPSRERHQ